MDSHEISVQPDVERCGHRLARAMGGVSVLGNTCCSDFGKEHLPALQYSGKWRFVVMGPDRSMRVPVIHRELPADGAKFQIGQEESPVKVGNTTGIAGFIRL